MGGWLTDLVNRINARSHAIGGVIREHAGDDSVPVFLSPGRQITDPDEAEALGLTVEARHVVELIDVTPVPEVTFRATQPPTMSMHIDFQLACCTLNGQPIVAKPCALAIAIAAADRRYPRIDLMVRRDNGVTVYTGTPADRPLPPPLPAGEWEFAAYVHVPAAATAIRDADIQPVRR